MRKRTSRKGLVACASRLAGKPHQPAELGYSTMVNGDLVPNVIEIMMDNALEHWGEACYPVR